MSSQMMTFPESLEEFIEEYSFKDEKEVYTNGSELIQVFRVRQMLEYYTRKHINSIVERLEEYRFEAEKDFVKEENVFVYGKYRAIEKAYEDAIKIVKGETE